LGAKGPTGDPGGPGPQGPQGNAAPKGIKGNKGVKGNSPIGDQGDQGASPKGDKGPKGLKGPTGLVGGVGPQGPQPARVDGDKGPVGAKGIKGIKGNIGPKGVTGDKGPIGSKGPSDKRMKENIQFLENTLEKLLKIRGVEFVYTDTKNLQNYKLTTQEIGVIAQEVQEVFPELVYENDKGILGVKYDNLVAIIVDAIQSQEYKIQEYEERVEKLESIAKEKGLI